MKMSLSLAAKRLDFRRELPQVLSLLLFLVVTALLFRSMEFALIVTASLGFHELGHAAALSWYRLDYRIFFGVVGAWTWSPSEERSRLSQLSNTYIHLAGPVFSLILSLAAMVLDLLWKPASSHLLVLANFSAQIGLINLLPVGVYTDGGKILRRMAMSVNMGKGKTTVLLLSGASVLAPALYAAWQMLQAGPHLPASVLWLLLIGVWLVASVVSEMRGEGSPTFTALRPMKPLHAAFLILLIWDMLAVLFFIMIKTPFWLAPEYLLGYLENIKITAGWLLRLFIL